MSTSPRVTVPVLLLVALVLVLTGARLATSSAAPAPEHHRDGTLLDFDRKDGRAVLPFTSEDVPKAPASFRRFVRSELTRTWKQELGGLPACRTSPRITVDTLRTDGFALGDVFSKPLKSCPNSGGGYIAIWAIRKGAWKQVIGTQEVVDCSRLERFDIPAELGIDQCYEGNEVVPYTHP
ncbi:hypothetical protein G5V58_11790 [Nocardioides anomalus]|uniref:Uncharacterized protein n=1 Tax=Nocardioides anomalus TaxID=2712223 RepID=A0A6G6WDS3_9ACTN|nr:hypothetical protein [Nocardioides anomalus]QIG43356.1 hypothetical protein G5V58_11790 [Nocardioides anomalus]